MTKPGLLFLAHRIPYPPDKGDKIRSYNLLRFLSRSYDIHLGAFVDDEADWQYRDTLMGICKSVKLVALHPGMARIRSLVGLLTGEALSLPYYRSPVMSAWVDDVIGREKPGAVVVFSSTMEQYVMHNEHVWKRRLIDFVDMDSDKWRQYADSVKGPMKYVYRREARYLLSYEQSLVGRFDYSFFVSEAEADTFLKAHPGGGESVGFYNNGVDSGYFTPEFECRSPYNRSHKVLVFTGAMDYWPNADAVVWFAREVLPKILARDPDWKFYIVGRNPDRRVQELAELKGVVVTGSVDDVRPYIKHACIAVAPMRIARGVQNKVLEAMAMARPVLVSPLGLEGIKVAADELMIADQPDEYVRQVLGLGKEAASEMGRSARQRILSDFGWDAALQPVARRLESAA
ncbi:TIGR03087 family PEP-CTERM/XrtA system glycosyltransferase [Pseudomaricurvus sp. HS19]|nr:TIGR03087 family PEP-CTERM/XrtA system glycosyltransferase [Pseudomaricurvus sp. HS19]MYM62028.1 TIGR03087 family PEP-CTERM/XrtA system glycosyltransferase [Pseudomaricurvus sp. HS19]